MSHRNARISLQFHTVSQPRRQYHLHGRENLKSRLYLRMLEDGGSSLCCVLHTSHLDTDY